MRWFWTLACLLSWHRQTQAQYTNEYNQLDIYPRIDFTFERALPPLDNETVDQCYYQHENVLNQLYNMQDFEEKLSTLDYTVDVQRPSLSGRHMFHSAVKTDRMSSSEPYDCYFETLSRELQQFTGRLIYNLEYEGPLKDTFCEPRNYYPCPEDNKYRTIDGTCNNHKEPSWGSAVSCYRRFLPAAYSDGISAFRLDKYGDPLPHPRLLTNYLHYEVDAQAKSYTQFLTQWGQWVAHDIISTKPYLLAGRDVVDCCKEGGEAAYSLYNRTLYEDPYRPSMHPQCRPIFLPEEDEFYGANQVRCMNFVRSAPCASCKIGPRDQTNKATAYLDASNVYGSSPETLDYLKDPFDYAKMAVQQTPLGYLLPRSSHPNMDQCSVLNSEQYCFAAGDSRNNQHPGICILHTAFVRYHNILVDIFRYINPHWDDYKIFEEVRRVISAQIQFITYREYIHLVIGPTLMTYFDLWTLKTGNSFYAEKLNAGIFNEIASAVYRYGHSLVSTEWWQVNTTSMEVMSYMDLKDYFFTSDYLYGQNYEELLLGMTVQPAMKFDGHIAETLSRYLYKIRGEGYGLDLPSFNIYRGRDHGLQGYTRYLEACYSVHVESFQDLLPFMTQENIDNLQKVYRHVSDIDLWSGGLNERLMRDGVVGPTFGCLIGMQYYFLKFGDRFYVEHGGLPSSFTDRQLAEIRKTWFSYIMCKTTDTIRYTTLDVFQPPSDYNPIIPCSQIPEPDWNAWFEYPPEHNPEGYLNEY